MTDPVQLPPADDAASHLPRHTTPTWEVELLISGIAVFAMLQLPGWLDDSIFALMPRLEDAWASLALLVYFYSKSAAVILAATFVIHLLLRARWIALVGIHSVYPDGVRWERLRMGPLQRKAESRHQVATAVVVERADNVATTVFAIGVMITLILITIIVVLALVFACANLMAWLAGVDADGFALVLALFAIVMLPYVLAILLDRAIGKRLAEGGLAQRALTGLLGLYARIGMSRSNNRIMALLSSHSGERRILAATLLIMFAAIIGVATAYNSLRDPSRAGGYALFPAAGDAHLPTVDPAHYDDQRDPARDEALPYVQSAIVDGPYLRLVVPYQPRRDAMALQRECPAIHERDPARRATGTLRCLQRLHALTLDGKPLVLSGYELGSDARTDRPALMAMIDVRALAPGRHQLQVARPATGRNDRDAGKEEDDATSSWRIPFWR